jgi:hypothetical protein
MYGPTPSFAAPKRAISWTSKPTDKKIEVKGIDIVKLVNGKAVEHWGVSDNLTMLQPLGVIPMPGQEAKD